MYSCIDQDNYYFYITVNIIIISTVFMHHHNFYCSFGSEGVPEIFKMSYQWFAPLGTVTCVVVGLIVSMVTGKEMQILNK